MIARTFLSRRSIPLLSLGVCLLGFTLVSPTALHAQAKPPAKEISEKVASELGKLRPLLDAKNYPEALRLTDSLLAIAANPSYDLAVLSQLKAQILLFSGNYAAATEPLEISLQLGDRYGFFEASTQLETYYTLGQLYYQLATGASKPAEQATYYNKAYAAITRWISLSPKPTSEGQLYAASILYGQALLDPAKPDLAKIAEVQRFAEQSLYLDLKPKPQAYLLLLASLQLRSDLVPMADLLELLVSRQPDSTTYWQQLVGTYYSLASDSKDPETAQRYNLRALLSLERAQAHGLLKSPKENYAVVALYFSLQRFDRAIPLLESGLKSGAIENSRRNWELLASAYQQTHDDKAALVTFKAAIERFPREASLEVSLGQLYYTLNRPAEAYEHLTAAVSKDHFERPGQTKLFIAYVAFELQRYEEASKWIESAADAPDAKKDDIARLQRAIADKLRDRAATAKPTA